MEDVVRKGIETAKDDLKKENAKKLNEEVGFFLFIHVPAF
jgi:hypothetical protein